MSFLNNLEGFKNKFALPDWVKDLRDLDKHLPAIKEALAKGTTATVSGVSNSGLALYGRLFISKQDLIELAEDLEDQGGRFRELQSGILVKKDRIKDCFSLGGEIYLLSALPDYFPKDIESAYATQYPNLASENSLGEHIRSLEADQQMGFVAGLKGKLFEQKYVDYLNEGELPEGFMASLAYSPVQKGWDIAIHNAEGNLDQVLQAKASESVGYVKEALEKYPSIDIVTTEEVYSQLIMQGISEGLINSGISNAEMVNHITTGLELDHAGLGLEDFYPPVLTAAMIAFTSYRNPDLYTLAEKTEAGGSRMGKAYFAYLLGGAVSAFTHTWWLGLGAAVMSRATADEGYRRFELMRQMKKAKRNNRIIIGRWAKEVKNGAFA